MSEDLGGPPRHPTTPANWESATPFLMRAPGRVHAPLEARPAKTVVVQFWSAYAALFVAGVFVQQSLQAGTYDGAVSFVAAPLLVIFSLVLPALTLAVVAVLGLVIRLLPALRSWWIAHAEIGLAGVVLGAWLIGSSYLAGTSYAGVLDGVAYSVIIPSWPLLISGWFTFAFFAFHAWIPARWRRRKAKVALAGCKAQG